MRGVAFLPLPPAFAPRSVPDAGASRGAASPHQWRRPRPVAAAAAVRRQPAAVVPRCSMSFSCVPPPLPSAAAAAAAAAATAAAVPPPPPPPTMGLPAQIGTAAAAVAPSSPLTPPSWVRYRARVAYDGTGFCGWQAQPTGRSVQATLAAALSRRLRSTVRVVGAGRTDAGVHAGGQVCHFDAPRGTDGPALRHALNRMLPQDVRVGMVEVAPPPRWVVLPPKGAPATPAAGATAAAAAAAVVVAADDADAATADAAQTLAADVRVAAGTSTAAAAGAPVPPATGTRTLLVPWHAISCARGKRYTYRLRFGGVEDPLAARFRAHEYREVDVPALAAALAALVGTHDYSSFANTAAGPGGGHTTSAQHNPVRTVAAAVLVAEGGAGGGSGGGGIPGAAPPAGGAVDYRVDFVLDAALYKMVRNLVGAALAVATGRLSLAALVRMRDEPRMGANRFVAPARGLTLVRVLYDTPFGDEAEDTEAVELLSAAAAAAEARAAAAAGGEGGAGRVEVAARSGGAWGAAAWDGAVAVTATEGAPY